MTTPDEYARRISHEMKFILRWVEARLKKVVPKRPGVHDYSLMMIFTGWDQVQYASNCHRDDAAQMLVDILTRWGKEGMIKTDIPMYAKQSTEMHVIVPALSEEAFNLMSEIQIRGGKPEDGLVFLEDILTRAMRVLAKKGHHMPVLEHLIACVGENLSKEEE